MTGKSSHDEMCLREYPSAAEDSHGPGSDLSRSFQKISSDHSSILLKLARYLSTVKPSEDFCQLVLVKGLHGAMTKLIYSLLGKMYLPVQESFTLQQVIEMSCSIEQNSWSWTEKRMTIEEPMSAVNLCNCLT